MTDAEELTLAQPEDEHSLDEWEAAAAAVLRKSGRIAEGDPDNLVWDKLTRTTLDGIGITPLGTATLLEGLTTSGRPTRAQAWDIRPRLADADPARGNEIALAELDGGATSLWLRLEDSDDLARLLDGVLLDLAPVVLDAPADRVGTARALLALFAERGVTPHDGTNLGADAATTPGEELVGIARLAQELGVRGVVVDATAVHDRGASDVQELAWSIEAGVRVLRTLTDAGLSAVEAARLIEFRYAATDEQFPTIAKLRAARRLWARVLELSEAAGVPQRQHVVTSRPMMSKYDPYVNMLRTTVAAFAAGVGGADAVTVLPFDSPLGKPDGFGRRIARNLHHLLIDESHVAAVADPAGGAYAVEKLTDDLAIAGWDLFGRLEAGEDLDPLIEEVVAERDRLVAHRRRPLTGLTEFPNLEETLPEREPDPTASEVRRYGADFEALRDRPATTPIFLATLGPIAQHTARATFASNLFAAGGVAVESAGATTDPADLARKYAAATTPTPVVCLAGSDAAYREWGEAAAGALREAGARHVIIAGRPVEYADDSCAAGLDALRFLTTTREKLA
ncbi:methylmalonyl-CoA mutase family protein [Nocardioides insulae]|uniref:methylmalonyl-CoA mutase family protein n=1 Tax=Nocardioides insulae TaxID=394734 RepID=UPI00048DE21E|nr:methylmalonyl-CoA mutase family protein [Nocardioides insulae]